MGILESVYDHSPIFFQNIMCSIAGKRKCGERYKGDYWKAREFCTFFDSLSKEEQEEYQRKRMVDFVHFANEQSPFYRELYKNVDLSTLQKVEDLKRLPIVTKEMLRKNIEAVYTIPKEDAVISNTGGTTGKSLTVRMTSADVNERMAILDHFKSRVGFENLKMKRATFNGKHIVPPKQKAHVYWRYNAPCKQMIYSSFDLSEDKMGYYVESLNRFKPAAIDGFFTSICDIANYIERHGLEVEFQPIGIFPTSETLTDDGRELIERVFKAKVYDQYASSEGAPFVTECKNQTLHIEMNTGVFEFLETGEVLVTSFTTHGTPLIRYAIGDKMDPEKDNSVCSCGCSGPIVKRIQGRKLDFLYKADGTKINAGNVSNLLKYVPNTVIRAQFQQEKIDTIRILLEVDEERFSKEMQKGIEKEFRHTFGDNMTFDFSIVEEIPRAASGKYKMIINTVPLDKGLAE